MRERAQITLRLCLALDREPTQPISPRLAERVYDTVGGGAPDQRVVRLPANCEAIYRRVVADLDRHLGSGDAMAARAAIRPLIEKIVSAA